MTLLHQDDLHFNLVVNKTSKLATLGSFSYRFNVGPIIWEEIKTYQMKSNIAENNEEETNDDSLHELIIVRKELKKSENRRKKNESEYFKCEKELRSKTEENEKL